jgi:dUTP pyrophosphatase
VPYIRYTTDDDGCTPYKKHRYDAGWDLRSSNPDFTLKAGAKVEVNLGIKLGIPRNYVGLIVPRSGLGTKYRVTLANSVGVIDADYRGEIKAYLVNDGHSDLEIKQYDRVCQLLIVPIVLQSMRRVGFLGDTGRGEDGFGHSGVE